MFLFWCLVHVGSQVQVRFCVSFSPYGVSFLYHVSCIRVTFLVHAGAGAASRECVSGNESETVRKLRCLRIWGRCAQLQNMTKSRGKW